MLAAWVRDPVPEAEKEFSFAFTFALQIHRSSRLHATSCQEVCVRTNAMKRLAVLLSKNNKSTCLSKNGLQAGGFGD
jgi:hypothetical protein